MQALCLALEDADRINMCDLSITCVYKQTPFIFNELFIEYVQVWPIYWVRNLTDTATKSLGLRGRGPQA